MLNVNQSIIANCDRRGTIALFDAIRANDYEICKILLRHKADVNYKNQSKWNENAFFIAVKEATPEIVMLLLKHKFNLKQMVNETDERGRTVAHYVCKKKMLQVFDKLLESDCELNKFDNNGFTAIHIACINNNSEIIKTLLFLQKYRLLNEGTNEKNPKTCLQLAIERGSSTTFELLASDENVIFNENAFESGLKNGFFREKVINLARKRYQFDLLQLFWFCKGKNIENVCKSISNQIPTATGIVGHSLELLPSRVHSFECIICSKMVDLLELGYCCVDCQFTLCNDCKEKSPYHKICNKREDYNCISIANSRILSKNDDAIENAIKQGDIGTIKFFLEREYNNASPQQQQQEQQQEWTPAHTVCLRNTEKNLEIFKEMTRLRYYGIKTFTKTGHFECVFLGITRFYRIEINNFTFC